MLLRVVRVLNFEIGEFYVSLKLEGQLVNYGKTQGHFMRKPFNLTITYRKLGYVECIHMIYTQTH